MCTSVVYKVDGEASQGHGKSTQTHGISKDVVIGASEEEVEKVATGASEIVVIVAASEDVVEAGVGTTSLLPKSLMGASKVEV